MEDLIIIFGIIVITVVLSYRHIELKEDVAELKDKVNDMEVYLKTRRHGE